MNYEEDLRQALQDTWAERNEARDRITAALELHRIYEWVDYMGHENADCVLDGEPWPCPTAKALGVTE